MENTFSVFQVKTYNFGSKEHISERSYSTLDKAKQALFEHCERVSSHTETVDLSGVHETYPHFAEIDNWISRCKPAIYYHSKYGNYKCVVYVQELFVY